MSGIGSWKLTFRQPLLLPEEKVGGSFPKGGAEGGSVKVRELGQKDPVFFLVAVKSPGLTAVCFVHIGSHTLMDSLVFFREIVIIFVIAIEVFQCTDEEGDSQKQLAAGNLCMNCSASEKKRTGKRKIQFQYKTAELFFRGNIPGDQVKLPFFQRGVAEKRKNFHHSFHIVPIVEHQHFFQAYFSGFQIGTVYFCQLTAGEGIFPENTTEDLAVFLAALGKIQKFLKRTDSAVKIEPRGIRPGEGKTVKVTAMLEVGDIKGSSVKMDQGRRDRKPFGKSFQDFCFLRRFFSEKLNQLPGAVLLKDHSQKIEVGTAVVESGRLNIKEERGVRESPAVQLFLQFVI